MKRKWTWFFASIMVVSQMLFACDGSVSTTSSQSSTNEPTLISNFSVFNESHVNWLGRTYYDTDRNLQFFNYSSSGFEVTFKGTQLVGTFVSTGYASDIHRVILSMFLDGEEDPRNSFDLILTEETASVTLVNNLEDTFHTVKVLKRTESQFSKVALQSLTTDGEFYTPPQKKERKIEIYGASTTCGYGNLATEGSATYSTATQSSLFSYASLISRVFDADYQMVCASGWAITRNKDADGVSLPTMYDKVDLNSQILWDLTKYVPDLVIINLATNDSVYIADATTGEEKEARVEAYYQGYINFINTLRTAYHNPRLPILMTYGFLYDDEVAPIIKDIKAYFAKQGDVYVDFVEVLKANATDGYGAGYHPSALTHIKSTNRLVNPIIELMDGKWDIVTPNLTSPYPG